MIKYECSAKIVPEGISFSKRMGSYVNPVCDENNCNRDTKINKTFYETVVKT